MTEVMSGELVADIPTEEQDSILEGENIICFAKDWGEDPTSCNHVLKGLSKKNRVVWLNSISTRSPNLGSARDTGKIFKKIAAFVRGPIKMHDNLWQFTPLVLPFHQKSLIVQLNKIILRLTIAMLRIRLGMSDFQLWTFVPTSAAYVGSLGAKLIVYYCTDNYSAFSSVDEKTTGSMMQSLATKADIVFATSHLLVDKLTVFNSNTHIATHGVNFDLFAQAIDPSTEIPPDAADLARPILGYYGLVEDWLDLDLLAYMAERHPTWSLVLLGKSMTDTSRLDKFPNVHLLGRKPHHELPNYCKAFTVGLIPHKINNLTLHMNPIKLREYMCAGLPVVSTDLPEARYFPNNCVTTETYAEFDAAVTAFVAGDSPALRAGRSAEMQSENWERKIIALSGIARQTLAQKRNKGRENLKNGIKEPVPERIS